MQASLNRVLLLKKTTSGEFRMVITGQHMLTSTRMWPPETLSYLRPAPTNDGRPPMVETAEALEDAFDVSVFWVGTLQLHPRKLSHKTPLPTGPVQVSCHFSGL